MERGYLSREEASRRPLAAGAWTPRLVLVPREPLVLELLCRWLFGSPCCSGDICPILKTAFGDSPASHPGLTQPSAGGQARSKLQGRGPKSLLVSHPQTLLLQARNSAAWLDPPPTVAYVRKLPSLNLGFVKPASGDNSAGLSFPWCLMNTLCGQCHFPRDVAVSLLLLFVGQCCRARKVALLFGDTQVSLPSLLRFATSPTP